MYLNDHKISLTAMAESVKDAEAIKELMSRAGIPVNNVTLVLIDSMRRAAYAAGREAMRDDAESAVLDLIYQDDVHPESGCANDMREAARAIRALPGKEWE